MKYKRDASWFPLASVIVPAYNEADQLRECLASLQAQDYPDYEVILVDNGSTDNTQQVCARFPNVHYIYFNHCKSSYAARNEGVRQARGEVLVFFDADQTARPDCLSLLLAEYDPRNPNRVYVGLLMDDPRIPAVLAGSYGYPSIEAQKKGQIRTCYVAVPRKLFDDLGGFKPEILSGGDLEFFGRAARVAQIRICSRAGGYHFWARNLQEVLAREERMGFGMCLRAKSEGRRTPGACRIFARVLLMGLVKSVAAMLVPLRFPKGQWRLRWGRQSVHWRSEMRRCVGVMKFKFGCKRAGDLPRTTAVAGPALAIVNHGMTEAQPKQPMVKVPHGDAPRISDGIEAEKRRVLFGNTQSFDNEEPVGKTQAATARLSPRAAKQDYDAHSID